MIPAHVVQVQTKSMIRLFGSISNEITEWTKDFQAFRVGPEARKFLEWTTNFALLNSNINMQLDDYWPIIARF